MNKTNQNLKMIATINGEIATYASQAKPNIPLVFLHSDSGRASQWADVMQLLESQYQTIGFDFVGHGNSEPNAQVNYGIKARASDLAGVVDGLKIEPFILVVHSGSVAVALEYAANNADNVKGLLLIEAATDPRGMPENMKQGFVAALNSPAAAETIQGYYASIAGGDPAIIAQVQDDAAIVNDQARRDVAIALLDWNPETSINAYIGDIEMHLIAANDHPGALYHLNPNIEHHLLTESGHWVQLNAPQKIADIVNVFASKLGK